MFHRSPWVVVQAAALAALALLLPQQASAQYELEKAFPGLEFEIPVDLAADDQGWLYVVERAGRIRAFPNDTTVTESSVFLDIREKIYKEEGEGEVGLLGLVFHPNYADNGYFYVYYTGRDPLRSVLARYERSNSDPVKADPASERVLLEVEQPTPRHNGGDLNFDAEGYLLASLGDGSNGGDTYDNAQDRSTLLGSIIRIDVDRPSQGRPYGIPGDNPFVGNDEGWREEIYAYGLRNPWRFSIDPETGRIWTGDVGETDWEEISVVLKGGNHGWPAMEGPACFDHSYECQPDSFVAPAFAYSHDVGRSVIGGYVYRGSRVPELQGKYIFADWVNKNVYALSYSGNDPLDEDSRISVDSLANVDKFFSGFGVDENDELYAYSTFSKGGIYWFKRTAEASSIPTEPREPEFAFELTGPNPFQHGTKWTVSNANNGRLVVTVYDMLGREVEVPFDRFVQAGENVDVHFSARGLGSGVYLVTARIGSKTVTSKVVLAR